MVFISVPVVGSGLSNILYEEERGKRLRHPKDNTMWLDEDVILRRLNPMSISD